MKHLIVSLLLIVILAGCKNESDDTQSLSAVTVFDHIMIKSYDTIIVYPYNEDGGSYIPSAGSDSASFDVNQDGENDYKIVVSHDQHTVNSPHDWQVDHLVMISSLKRNFGIAIDPSEPVYIQEFLPGDRVDDRYQYQSEVCIVRSISYTDHATDVYQSGDLVIGLRNSSHNKPSRFGYLELNFNGNYVILGKSVFELHKSYCFVDTQLP
jgi:hypothetical protein